MLVPALLLLAAWPFGATRVNDDWQMYLSAFRFAREGEVFIPNYSAMGMVGWTVPVGALLGLVGESFLLPRLLTMATIPLTGLFAYLAAREWRVGRGDALLVSIAVSTSPVLFWLSTSFMTDAPWHCAWVGAIWLWSRALRTGRLLDWVGGAALVAWASWVRIPVVALPLAATCALLWCGSRVRRGSGVWASVTGSFVLGAVAFSLWYRWGHGPTDAYGYKSEFSIELMASYAPGALFATVVYAGVFLFPLLPLVWPAERSERRAALGCGAVAGALALAQAKFGFLTGVTKSMPYLMNVLYDLGLGPLTLTDTAREGGPPPVDLPGLVQVGVGVGAAALGGALVCLLVRRTWGAVTERRSPQVVLVAGALVLYAGAAILFSKPRAPLFDRYLVALALPAALLLLRPSPDPDSAPVSRGRRMWAAVLVAVVALFSVAGTWDYHRFNDARFRLGRRALELTGDTTRVDAGAEFNLFHNYQLSHTGQFEHPQWWKGWLAYPEYVVATREREGFEVVDREPLFNLVGLHRWDLLLLRLVDPPK